MTLLDWMIVLVVNGAIIAYGMYLARKTKDSGDWFLASRSLPWWAIGVSMFATNVDNADLVGVTGNTYIEGIHIISVYGIGSALGGVLAAWFVVPAISRRGFYTNAEYLEARYGVGCRLLSALIQIQYRTSMLGLMIWSAYLSLTRLVMIPPATAWTLIVGLILFTGVYAAWGGLKSVVWTDTLQGLVMIVAALVIFVTVWNVVGGWETLRETLLAADARDGTQKERLMHISGFRGDSGELSPYLVVLAWTIIGSGYWTVNHTQTIRLMGARSLRDMRLAAVAGILLSLPVMAISACLGLFGHGLSGLPEMTTPDELYPILANRFLGPGLKGIVVAGVVAALMSAVDSMGSALSAIFTRDVYARLFVRDREDAHYLRVGRIASLGVLLIGFAYLPFIIGQDHMLKAFTTLIPVFVTPLFTIYVVGALTRVHRRSGMAGMLVGSLYGVVALCDRAFYDIPALPAWFTERMIALPWSILFTLLPMLLTTLINGPHSATAEAQFAETGWLQRSRETLPPLPDENASPSAGEIVSTAAMILFCLWLTFVWLW